MRPQMNLMFQYGGLPALNTCNHNWALPQRKVLMHRLAGWQVPGVTCYIAAQLESSTSIRVLTKVSSSEKLSMAMNHMTKE